VEPTRRLREEEKEEGVGWGWGGGKARMAMEGEGREKHLSWGTSIGLGTVKGKSRIEILNPQCTEGSVLSNAH
jgi:hypothetical protein